MKRKIKTILPVIEMPKTVLLFCLASWLFNMNPKFQQIQFGIPAGLVGNDIDSAIAGWLAMTMIPMAYAGFMLSRLNSMEPFMILRQQTKRRAYLYRLCCCMVCVLFYVIMLIAPLFASCRHDAVLGAALLLFLEEVLWMLSYLFFCLFMNTVSAGACMILLVTCCCMVCKHIPAAEPFMPTTWGMYCRTEAMLAEGAPLGTFALRLIIACMVLLGINIWICTAKKGRG